MNSAEEIIIEEVGEFWWVCGKHRPEFIAAMHRFAKEYHELPEECIHDFSDSKFCDEKGQCKRCAL